MQKKLQYQLNPVITYYNCTYTFYNRSIKFNIKTDETGEQTFVVIRVYDGYSIQHIKERHPLKHFDGIKKNLVDTLESQKYMILIFFQTKKQ